MLNNISLFGACLLAEDNRQAWRESLGQSLAQVPTLGRNKLLCSVLAQLLVPSPRHLADLSWPGGGGGGGGPVLFWDRQSCSLAGVTIT